MGFGALRFKDDENSENTELVMQSNATNAGWWIDLPKLATLETTNQKYHVYRGDCGTEKNSLSYSFKNPRHITLESDSHPLWMMFRHAQSHQCVSSTCIRLQEWRHNQRKYSLHPSLTNRHRSSCKSRESEIEAPDSSLCTTHNPQQPLPVHLRARPAAFERALSLCEHGNNDDPHLKWWKSNQNRGNWK